MFSKQDLKKLIIPLIIEQTLAITIGMIDTVMVSSVGEDAVSAVALVDPINILITNLFSALATGGAIIVSQYLGKEDEQQAKHASKQLILSTFLLSFGIMIVCLLLQSQILSLVFGQTEEIVMKQALTYFFVTILSYPFIATYNGAAALFRSIGNSKISMFNALIMNVLNIIGNSILIYIFDLGVLGAAISTLVSRIVACIAMIIMLRDKTLPISLRNYSFKGLDLKMIKRILSIGIPNGLENSMFQIGKILVVSIVASFGTRAITANSVANSIASIEIIPGAAIGLAIITVVGRCVGANDFEQAEYYLKCLLKLCFKIMIGLNILILIGLKPIIGIYNLSDETFKIAYQLLILHGISAMIVWPIAFSLPNAFRAANDVKYTMYISIISMWTCRICLSILLAKYLNMGVIGVWIAMITDWCFRAVFFIKRWVSGKWKTKVLHQEKAVS